MTTVYEIKPYEQADYSVIAPWWEAHGVRAIPEGLLPAMGYVAWRDGVRLAAAWCYCDSTTDAALLAWPVVNPEAGRVCRRMALAGLEKKICEVLLGNGRTYLLKMAAHSGVISKGDELLTDRRVTITCRNTWAQPQYH